MSQAKILQEKAEMFERRAETATDPISRQHYKEMAAHYRSQTGTKKSIWLPASRASGI